MYYHPSEVKSTSCCALVHITARNSTTYASLRGSLYLAKEQGKRAAFVITKDDEPKLVIKMKRLGFKKVSQFGRRSYAGLLKMWVKKW
jgi:hypothetical protein